jgi:L-malate glycosyltransferase
MRILFVTLGNETLASSRVRAYQLVPALAAKGFYSRVFPIEDLYLAKFRVIRRPVKLIRLLAAIILAAFYDVVILQKVVLPPILLSLLFRFNSSLIFEFDDALHIGHGSHKLFWGPKRTRAWLSNTVQKVRLFTVTNEFLAAYIRARNRYAKILQFMGPIDTQLYFPREAGARLDSSIVLGWIGTPSNTVYLNLLTDILECLATEFSHLKLLLIGAMPYSVPGLRIETVRWSLGTEVDQLRRVDIGLMPLLDDEWTKGKGGYKALQYMAMGIPFVASGIATLAELSADGQAGFFASSPEDWHNYLRRLIQDESLRERMGRTGRETAVALYSIDVQSHKLAKFLDHLVKENRV